MMAVVKNTNDPIMLQLRLSNFNVAYQGIPAIIDLSVTLTAATVNLVTGVLGAGKTSLIRAISGAIGHSGGMELREGISTYDQRSIIQPPPRRTLVSPHMNVTQFLQLGLMKHAWQLPPDTNERIRDALERCDLTSLAYSPLSSLTLTQMRLAETAQLFAQQPRVILLDESSDRLAKTSEASVLTCISKWVHETQSIALVASESRTLPINVDRVLTLESGRLLAA